MHYVSLPANRCNIEAFSCNFDPSTHITLKQAHVPKSTAPTVSAKKKLKELFDDRNGTRARSKEEKQEAEKLLEALFPNGNAG
jgi:hypothetical protein